MLCFAILLGFFSGAPCVYTFIQFQFWILYFLKIQQRFTIFSTCRKVKFIYVERIIHDSLSSRRQYVVVVGCRQNSIQLSIMKVIRFLFSRCDGLKIYEFGGGVDVSVVLETFSTGFSLIANLWLNGRIIIIFYYQPENFISLPWQSILQL